MPNWIWIPSLKSYRDLDTGRFASQADVRQWAWESMEASEVRTDDLAVMLAEDQINLATWEELMRKEIRLEYIRQYEVARGGREQMTPRDWGILGSQLKEQWGYLGDFSRTISKGKLTLGQVAARSRLYIRSGSQARERGRAESLGVPKLPAYPGDGKTICRTNCGCAWDLQQVTDETEKVVAWECTWVINPTLENCEDCQTNAAKWNPLVKEVE